MTKISTYHIDKIRTENRIEKYLAELGIFPSHTYADKMSYFCPLSFHEDTNPSFFVYVDGDYDNFYCFSCKNSGGIIELHRCIKKISSWGQAAKDLSSSENKIDFEEELDYAVKEMQKTNRDKEIASLPGKMALIISSMGFNHLCASEKDSLEYEFLESLYKEIDKCVWESDINKLISIFSFLTEEMVIAADGMEMSPLAYKAWQFANKKEDRLKKQYEEIKVYEEM